MASVNKVILLGNVGKDPEIKYTASGTAVCSISIATSRAWKDKNTGEKQEETEWHRVVLYERLAEIVGEYVHKGDPIYVEARSKTRKWEKNGVDMYTTEFIVENLQLLGGKSERQAPRQEAPQRQTPDRQQRPAQRQAATTGTGFDNMEDDIPF